MRTLDPLLPVMTVRFWAVRRSDLMRNSYIARSGHRDKTMLYRALEMLTRWRLFRRLKSPERTWDVIGWWESRRIPYNVIVGGAGIVSGAVMLTMGFVTEHVPGEAIDPGSPLFAMIAVLFYVIMANVCFTGGWILELLSRRLWGPRAEAFGEIAFTWGTLCSVLLTLTPAALTVVIGTCRILARGWNH
jgi:hypothetical protein